MVGQPRRKWRGSLASVVWVFSGGGMMMEEGREEKDDVIHANKGNKRIS